ncbi:uncharacterized protein K452DRAFT_322314, partial [Aplosporella prunicola CBS 121167]
MRTSFALLALANTFASTSSAIPLQRGSEQCQDDIDRSDFVRSRYCYSLISGSDQDFCERFERTPQENRRHVGGCSPVRIEEVCKYLPKSVSSAASTAGTGSGAYTFSASTVTSASSGSAPSFPFSASHGTYTVQGSSSAQASQGVYDASASTILLPSTAVVSSISSPLRASQQQSSSPSLSGSSNGIPLAISNAKAGSTNIVVPGVASTAVVPSLSTSTAYYTTTMTVSEVGLPVSTKTVTLTELFTVIPPGTFTEISPAPASPSVTLVEVTVSAGTTYYETVYLMATSETGVRSSSAASSLASTISTVFGSSTP